MKKNKIIISIILIIIVGLVIGFIYSYKVAKNKYYVDQRNTVAVEEDTMSKQKKIDEELTGYQNDSKYNLDSPKIILNPYETAPLSAIIIFQTKSEVSYDVYINDNKFTTVEASKKHSIPIYGLVAGTTNVVKLVGSDNSSKEYNIETASDTYALNVDTSNVKYDDVYFVAGPMGLSYGAFNADGKLVWYFTGAGAQDIEFLSNGHLLISNDELYGAMGYTGFYEIDYLGKIYKKYVLENNYHQEVNELKDGNFLVASCPSDSKIQNATINTIDKDTGAILKSLDLYDVINKVDSTLANKLIGTNAINNSIYYDEDTDNLVLSLRGYNTIMSVNYSTGDINWMIGSISDWSSNFSKYMLKASDSSRLPKGQHTAFIDSNGYLGVFNNDYNPNDLNTALSYYKNNYSTATLYQLDLNNKTFKTAYEYVDADHVFNYALGSFNETSDNHKIVNFGWSFKKTAYDNNLSMVDYQNNTYSRIVDLDANNNIVFRATLDESAYRVFKGKLYNDTTANYVITSSKIIDTVPYNKVNEVNTSEIESNLNNAEDSIYDVKLTKTTVNINAIFDTLNDVNIIFVGDNGKSYTFAYKPSGESTPVRVNLDLTGKYAIYLKIDNIWYNTNTSVDFDK
jgi:arylsulfate sulfotransferase